TGMLEAIGVVELVCYRERGIVPIHLSWVMWKSNLGNGRAETEEVNDTIEMLFELSVSSSQRLDAIGIAYAAFCGIGSER
ncbi:MAG: crossover junction endodeoxyribonuclease RuvC, partial [Microcystaceae cyanobacterium]